jgi:hypothetical protein
VPLAPKDHGDFEGFDRSREGGHSLLGGPRLALSILATKVRSWAGKALEQLVPGPHL